MKNKYLPVGLLAALALPFAGALFAQTAAPAAAPVTIPAAIVGASSVYAENSRVIPPPAPTATDIVQVTLDRTDWTYPLSAIATFKVKLAVTPYPTAGIPITYRVGPEQLEGTERTAIVPAEGLTIPGGTRQEPGLTRLLVSATLDGKPIKSFATAAFAPGRILPTQTEPSDFDKFWEKQKTELAKIPAEPELTPMPELSTPEVEVFQWSAQNIGNYEGFSRVYGILAVPRGHGPFPAYLNVPGAGVRGYKGQVALAAKGVITLEIGIHGLPVTLEPKVYAALSRAGLNNYQVCGIDDRTNYYYRRVILGCLRANDALTSHPKWDGKTLITSGSSQGGMLSIITGTLDSRVTAIAAAYPAYCDVTGYLHGRAGGWPGLFRPRADGKLQSPVADDPRVITTSYYDTLNFARRLKIPGFYSFGYNDNVCPPTSMFAAYNVITAPKELVLSPEQTHHLSKPQIQLRTDWIDAQLGLAVKK